MWMSKNEKAYIDAGLGLVHQKSVFIIEMHCGIAVVWAKEWGCCMWVYGNERERERGSVCERERETRVDSVMLCVIYWLNEGCLFQFRQQGFSTLSARICNLLNSSRAPVGSPLDSALDLPQRRYSLLVPLLLLPSPSPSPNPQRQRTRRRSHSRAMCKATCMCDFTRWQRRGMEQLSSNSCRRTDGDTLKAVV